MTYNVLNLYFEKLNQESQETSSKRPSPKTSAMIQIRLDHIYITYRVQFRKKEKMVCLEPWQNTDS